MTVHEFLARSKSNLDVTLEDTNSDDILETTVFNVTDFEVDGKWNTAEIEDYEIVNDHIYMNVTID